MASARSSCKDLLDRIPQGALQDFTRSSHKDLRKITRGLLKSWGFRQDLHKILFPARTSTNPWSRSKFLRARYETLAVIEGPFRELRRSVWRDLWKSTKMRAVQGKQTDERVPRAVPEWAARRNKNVWHARSDERLARAMLKWASRHNESNPIRTKWREDMKGLCEHLLEFRQTLRVTKHECWRCPTTTFYPMGLHFFTEVYKVLRPLRNMSLGSEGLSLTRNIISQTASHVDPGPPTLYQLAQSTALATWMRKTRRKPHNCHARVKAGFDPRLRSNMIGMAQMRALRAGITRPSEESQTRQRRWACVDEMHMDISEGNFCASQRSQKPQTRTRTLNQTGLYMVLHGFTLAVRTHQCGQTVWVKISKKLFHWSLSASAT